MTDQKKQRQRLTIDLSDLFPGESVDVGGQAVIIKPLVAEQIATLLTQAKGFGVILSEQGVTWDNYNLPENVFKIASTLITQFPEILEELSDVHQDDLKKLPIELIVVILDKVIEVNLRAKDALEKNSKSLTTLFRRTTPKVPEKTETQETEEKQA